MMRNLPAIVMVLVVGPVAAQAGDLVVTRPGIMCRSAAALAQLTLPGGDSRTHRETPRPGDLAAAGNGGCRDLIIGQRLTVLQAFRNTARVTLNDAGPATPEAVFIVPTIDLGPAPPAPPASSASAAAPAAVPDADTDAGSSDDPMSDAMLNALIGQTKEAFVTAHPGGRCTRTGPEDESCVFDAGTYAAGDQSSCPFEFACTVTMYGFHDGRLTSFQSGLQFEYEWKRAYRLALKHYDLPVTQRSATGASAFFRTRNGVLGFGHTFGGQGRPPTWAIRYYLSDQPSDSAQ